MSDHECEYCGPHTKAVHDAALWYHPDKMDNHAIQEQYQQMQYPIDLNDRRDVR